MKADVKRWLKDHGEHFEAIKSEAGEKRIRCVSTGHELIPRLEVLEAYVRGKMFRKSLTKQASAEFIALNHIKPHSRRKGMLHCGACGRDLNNVESELKVHVEGKRHVRRVEEMRQEIEKRAEDEQIPVWAREDESDEDDANDDNDDIEPRKKKTRLTPHLEDQAS